MKPLLFSFLLFSLCISAAPIPNAQFVSSQNKPIQFYDLKDNFLFVSFIYTRCPLPKMCPLTMTLNKQVWRKIKTTLPDTKIKFLIVTLDPEVDTPKVLASYGKKFKLDEKDFILTTGNSQVLSDFASQFNVIGFTNSDGTVSHNLKSVLVAPDLSEIKTYKENEWKPEEVLTDLKSYITARSQTEASKN